MAKHRTHRTHSIAFKRQVVQEYLAGETLHGLARRHELSRTLIRIWVDKYEAGAFDEDTEAAEHDPGIRGPDRGAGAPGRQAGPGARVSKRGSAARTTAEKRAHVRHHRPEGLSVAEGCRLMGIAQSTYYHEPKGTADDTALVEDMHAIKDEFEGPTSRSRGAIALCFLPCHPQTTPQSRVLGQRLAEHRRKQWGVMLGDSISWAPSARRAPQGLDE